MEAEHFHLYRKFSWMVLICGFPLLFLISLVFSSLTIMYLDVSLVFTRLRVHWPSWICKLIVFPKLGKILPLFLQIFPAQLSLFFWNSSYTNVRLLDIVPHHWNCLRSLCSFYWIIPIDISSSIPTLCSVHYSLLLNSSTIIFISHVVLSSRISIWFSTKIPHLSTQECKWRNVFHILVAFILSLPFGHSLDLRAC